MAYNFLYPVGSSSLQRCSIKNVSSQRPWAVAGKAFPPPHQTEAALGVQAAAGLVVLQYGGLQGPVARRIGSVAQSREQVEADAPAPELLAHIDAHFHHAP